MNKYIITGLALLALPFMLLAQKSVDDILIQIEKNNTTLSAMRKSTDARKVGNKTGIYMQNPELEFNYLWGNPSAIGNRTDFSLRQSFDFPTAYRFKNQISDIKNEQAELEYHKQQKEILFHARNICIDLMYCNALKAEYSMRLNHAQNIAISYKLKFDAGDANILEFNKAQLNLLSLNNKINLLEIDCTTLLSELTLLNGGIAVEFSESEFQLLIIPLDFEQWYAQAEQNNPVLSWLKQEIEISKKQVSLNKALSLPKLQAGYMSETVVGQQFRGISVGLSIPLWENKNTVKYAKANTMALESVATDNKVQFYNQLKTLHSKAIRLQSNLTDYRSKLQSFNSSDLLKKALDKGEISLIDYIMELSVYYENLNQMLELEKELNKTVSELNRYL